MNWIGERCSITKLLKLLPHLPRAKKLIIHALRCYKETWKYNIIFYHFQHWNGTGNWNHSSQKTSFPYIINTFIYDCWAEKPHKLEICVVIMVMIIWFPSVWTTYCFVPDGYLWDQLAIFILVQQFSIYIEVYFQVAVRLHSEKLNIRLF